ncbi:hypothetical protein QQS21_000583 [Conoideocrella luteorostrata]|uniref:Uncharacterized protein n=1 Tax=Conoideocrella luteorostrata TaxID=1105319 RepID=A0AAJ0CZQ0_9HYPO|nr:hypothetical protein QQS21_000583 [Conoideocrella luteorostrata]
MRFEVFIGAAISFLVYKVRAGDAAGAAVQSLNPSEILTSINTIGNISSETRDLFEDVKLYKNTKLIPKALNNLQEFITTALNTNSFIQKSDRPSFTEETQDSICVNFAIVSPCRSNINLQIRSKTLNVTNQFISVLQELEESIINASDAVGSSPFKAPIGATSRIIEPTVENLVFSITTIVPDCAWQFESAQESLKETLGRAVQTYKSVQTRKA